MQFTPGVALTRMCKTYSYTSQMVLTIKYFAAL